jgi:hypothetical protein
MATQALQQFEVESTKTLRLGDMLPKRVWTIFGSTAPAFARGRERACDADAADGNIIHGVVVAFCLEVAAAFAIYGIWHVWHILR